MPPLCFCTQTDLSCQTSGERWSCSCMRSPQANPMSTCGFFVLREQCCRVDLPVECVSHFFWIVEGRWVGLALLFPKLSRTPSSFSSCLLLIPSRVSTLAIDARLGERLHHDFVRSTNCIPRTASQVLRRGLFIRELVSHGDTDVDNFANVVHLRRAPGFLYSLDRGNLALYHHGDIPFCRLPELVGFPLSSERVCTVGIWSL